MRTVGCFTDGHGRAAPAAFSGLPCTAKPGLLALRRSRWWRAGPWPPCARARWERRACCHSPHPAVSVPSRAARAASPRRRPGRNRTPSAGIGPRAAALALTSPARVPAGQQANISETFLCMRGVPSMDLARAGDRTGRVLGWRRHGRRDGDLVRTAAPLTLALAGVYLAQIGRAARCLLVGGSSLRAALRCWGHASCVTEERHLDVRPSRESWGLDFWEDAGSRRHGGPQTWQPPDLPGRTAFLNCARTT